VPAALDDTGLRGGPKGEGMVRRASTCISVVLIAVFFSASCASQRDMTSLNNRLNALYRETRKEGRQFDESVKRLEEELRANEARQKEIEGHQNTLKEGEEALRLQLAQLGADLVGIRESIQTLTGRVEENSHLLQRTVEADTTKEDSMASQMEKTSSTIGDLKSRMEKIENYFGLATAGKREKAGLEKPPPTQEMGQEAVGVAEKEKLPESVTYDRALGYYKEGRYEDAIGLFQNFLKLYPKSDLADNAYFWIGESQKDLGRYEEAILAYQKVIDGYPNGNKVPAAMLQQAFAFERMNDKTTADLVLKKLVKKFPNTNEAQIAEKRLKRD
jgi:tol-pal system protein YbgF